MKLLHPRDRFIIPELGCTILDTQTTDDRAQEGSLRYPTINEHLQRRGLPYEDFA